MNKINKISLLMAIALIFTCGCGKLGMKTLSYTGTALDTVISIQIFDSNDEELIEHCIDICNTYESKLSRTIEASEICQINNANGAPVEVSPETIRVIEKGIYYGDLSSGAFDITIGSVTSLWDFKAENPVPPSAEVIAEAVNHVNYKTIVVQNNTGRLMDPYAKLDLGAIAKGFIADEIKKYLESQGVEHALINLGGNVLAIGNKLDGSDYNIGIQTPFDTETGPIASVKINDQSIVTSGTYQRYYKYNNNLYHHIIDPYTGNPCNNGLNSVTIITDSSLTADALSTTCFVLGMEKGMHLINQLDNVDAIFINTDNEVFYSNNFMHK